MGTALILGAFRLAHTTIKPDPVAHTYSS